MKALEAEAGRRKGHRQIGKSVGTEACGKSTPLLLNIYRVYFDQIVAGTKRTEYRDNTAFWRARLAGRSYSEVHFRNGYAKKAPFMRVRCLGIQKIGKGRGSHFAIRLGKVLEIRNYK